MERLDEQTLDQEGIRIPVLYGRSGQARTANMEKAQAG
jgi:hypothetical protein